MATLKDLYLEEEHKTICSQEGCASSSKSKEKCGRCFRIFLKGRASATRTCKKCQYELSINNFDMIDPIGTYSDECSVCLEESRRTYKKANYGLNNKGVKP